MWSWLLLQLFLLRPFPYVHTCTSHRFRFGPENVCEPVRNYPHPCCYFNSNKFQCYVVYLMFYFLFFLLLLLLALTLNLSMFSILCAPISINDCFFSYFSLLLQQIPILLYRARLHFFPFVFNLSEVRLVRIANEWDP